MKKALVMMVAVCAMSMTTAVYAQEQCPEQKNPNRQELKAQRAELMKKELNLSDEQMQQMKVANEEFQAARKANMENMKAAKEKHEATVEKVLTPEQKVKYDELKKKHPGEKGFRPHTGHKASKGVKMEGKECRRPELKCDSMPGKHHRKGHKHHDFKCDSNAKKNCKGECPDMKGCDKKQDCPKMKGECTKDKACDKKCADCPKDCDKKQDCKKDCKKACKK